MESYSDEFYDSEDSVALIAPLRTRLSLFDDVPGGQATSSPAQTSSPGASAPSGPTRYTETPAATLSNGRAAYSGSVNDQPSVPPATPTPSSSLPNNPH
jgi:hypothetical protein